MDKINKLKQQITDIEDQAGQLDAADFPALYELLSVAYFAAKDIIALQEGNVPVVEDEASKVALADAENLLATSNIALAEAKKVIIEQQSKIVQVLKIVS